MKFWICAVLILLKAISIAAAETCSERSTIQTLRSQELQTLYTEDQSDYRKQIGEHPDQPIDPAKLKAMADNDLKRRKQIQEIFDEGCFLKAADFAAAAMIFQHGDQPEHYLQAFEWAKKAVEKGDSSSKSLIAKAIDRYLAKSGRKQLFGTQADKSTMDGCFCLSPVEESFPDSKREEYLGRRLPDQVQWLKSLNGSKSCPEIYCHTKAMPSPLGTVVGFW